MNKKLIPPPPGFVATTTPALIRDGYSVRPDSTPTPEHSPWDHPLDLGVTRPNFGAHGGLTKAGQNDLAKKRVLFAQARDEGRLATTR